MTEDEAKTKWCPLSTDENGYFVSSCTASDCMWWVFDSVIGTEPDSKPVITTDGHCGAVK